MGFFLCRNLKNPMVLLKSDNLWKNESLREYFAYVHSFDPVISKEADKILSSVFLYLRSNTTDRLEDRTTVRLLDSLIRYFDYCYYWMLIIDKFGY